MNVSSKKADRKTPWLERGLAILTEKGPASLSIDELCGSMEKTKGSYYHHFKNRDEYIEALMQYYLRITTEDVIEEINSRTDAVAALNDLRETVMLLPAKTELAIRAWALYDATVKKYQDRIDMARISHIEALYHGIFKNRSKAHRTAIKHYSIFIGFLQLKDKMSPDTMKTIVKELFTA